MNLCHLPPIYSTVHCGLSADCPAVHSGDTQARPVQAGQCRAGTCTPCQPTHTLTSPPSLPPSLSPPSLPPSSLLSARSACLQPVIHPQERLKLGPETRTSGLQSENYQTPLSLSLLCWGPSWSYLDDPMYFYSSCLGSIFDICR